MRPRKANSDAIASDIARQIDEGLLVSGQRLPSERELASTYGASRACVQRAIRILDTRGYIECKPNCRPTVSFSGGPNRSGRRQKDGQIAVWIHTSLADQGAAILLQGVRRALGAAGYKAVIGDADSSDWESARTAEAHFVESLRTAQNIDGAIVWHFGGEWPEPTYEAYRNLPMPFVFVDRDPPCKVCADVVATDHRRAAERAVEYLISLGHKRIAMVANSEMASSVRDRIESYHSALRRAGLPIEERYFIKLDVDMEQRIGAEGKALVDALLCQDEPPTAIFAVNDLLAFHVREIAEHHGINIPAQLSLIGFDWYLRWHPTGGDLTTVQQHFEEIGKVAVQRLMARLGDEALAPPQHVLIDAPLVQKGTTAPALVSLTSRQ